MCSTELSQNQTLHSPKHWAILKRSVNSTITALYNNPYKCCYTTAARLILLTPVHIVWYSLSFQIKQNKNKIKQKQMQMLLKWNISYHIGLIKYHILITSFLVM